MKKSKKAVFIADPYERFNHEVETTYFLMSEALRRGFECHHVLLQDLWLDQDLVHARSTRLNVVYNQKRFDTKVLSQQILNLNEVELVFVRKDPPIDMTYISHLQILQFLENRGPVLVNRPRGILHANEKLLPLEFSKVSPPTCVSSHPEVIKNFLKTHHKIILKPLYSFGGVGIVSLEEGDQNTNSLIEMLTQDGKNYMMAQKFIKESKEGDKRILLLDGEVLGSFLRVPSSQDFRCNLHSGGHLEKTSVTTQDKKLINIISGYLKEEGLRFIGLDIIGNYITEINSTSPMGLREINAVVSYKSEQMFFDILGS